MYKIKRGTRNDLSDMTYLEEKHFGIDRAETREAYNLVLRMKGNVLIAYIDKTPEGMLATVPLTERLKTRALTLPERSPFRKRVERGYLDGYDEYDFVMSFVPLFSSISIIKEILYLRLLSL